MEHVWLSGRLHIEGRLNEGPRLIKYDKPSGFEQKPRDALLLIYSFFGEDNSSFFCRNVGEAIEHILKRHLLC